MRSRSAFGRAARLGAAAALAIWIAAAGLILASQLTASSTHPEARFTAIGELLLPAILLAAVAFVFVLVPRRFAGGWVIVFLFAVLGLPALVFQRHASDRAVPTATGAVQ